MGDVVEYHPKYLNRLADVYLNILRNKGPVEADDYVARMFTREMVEKVAPIIRKKSMKK